MNEILFSVSRRVFSTAALSLRQTSPENARSLSEIDRRILVAHELGHDRLHKKIAPLVGFQETGMFIKSLPTEYEANLFAADLLIDDDELRGFLNDDDKTHSGAASELGVPIELLDFKFRLMEHKGLISLY